MPCKRTHAKAARLPVAVSLSSIIAAFKFVFVIICCFEVQADEYWCLERHLAAQMLSIGVASKQGASGAAEGLQLPEVMRAHEAKSFDYRVRCLGTRMGPRNWSLAADVIESLVWLAAQHLAGRSSFVTYAPQGSAAAYIGSAAGRQAGGAGRRHLASKFCTYALPFLHTAFCEAFHWKHTADPGHRYQSSHSHHTLRASYTLRTAFPPAAVVPSAPPPGRRALR